MKHVHADALDGEAEVSADAMVHIEGCFMLVRDMVPTIVRVFYVVNISYEAIGVCVMWWVSSAHRLTSTILCYYLH